MSEDNQSDNASQTDDAAVETLSLADFITRISGDIYGAEFGDEDGPYVDEVIPDENDPSNIIVRVSDGSVFHVKSTKM